MIEKIKSSDSVIAAVKLNEIIDVVNKLLEGFEGEANSDPEKYAHGKKLFEEKNGEFVEVGTIEAVKRENNKTSLIINCGVDSNNP